MKKSAKSTASDDGPTIVWRLEKKKYSAEPFSGHGAYLSGGRWNHRGVNVVYTSQTLALAALEKLINIEARFARNYVAISATIPSKVTIKRIEISDLPGNWRDYNASPVELKDIGTEWLSRGVSALLSVPSVIVPEERNYIINPAHPDFRKMKIGKPEAFEFDPRLFK